MITWRHADPEDRLRDDLQRVVTEFEGDVEWVMGVSARNRVVVPCRLADAFAQDAPRYVGFLADLEKSDQEFCIRATADPGILPERVREPWNAPSGRRVRGCRVGGPRRSGVRDQPCSPGVPGRG
jgi:hypothetical protein